MIKELKLPISKIDQVAKLLGGTVETGEDGTTYKISFDFTSLCFVFEKNNSKDVASVYNSSGTRTVRLSLAAATSGLSDPATTYTVFKSADNDIVGFMLGENRRGFLLIAKTSTGNYRGICSSSASGNAEGGAIEGASSNSCSIIIERSDDERVKETYSFPGAVALRNDGKYPFSLFQLPDHCASGIYNDLYCLYTSPVAINEVTVCRAGEKNYLCIKPYGTERLFVKI